jgi:hypothetical protein
VNCSSKKLSGVLPSLPPPFGVPIAYPTENPGISLREISTTISRKKTEMNPTKFRLGKEYNY